jgi:hypothetical protein
MANRRGEGRHVRLTVAVIAALIVTATGARAHQDPGGCFETGVSIVVTVLRADGTTGVVGSVSECETINYKARITKGVELSDDICAFSGGVFSITLPNGMTHVIANPVPCIGGDGPGEGCDPTVTRLESGLFPYTVQPGDVVGGIIEATAQYTGGVAHDSPGNTAGVSGTTPKQTPVSFCPEDTPCTEFICDPSVSGSAACTPSPIDCNDNDACTIDDCDSTTGCFTTPVICEDNNLCTSNVCNPATGTCVFDPVLDCDDNDECTDDFCDPVLGCQSVPNDNPACLGLRHVMCYEIKRFSFARRMIDVEDRFFDGPVTLRTPSHLCAPADKEDEDPNAPLDPEHLMGFPARGTTGKVLNQTVTNQFGTLTLDLRRRSHLFVPTAKSLAAQPPPLVNPIIDHFQCYRVRRSRGSASFSRIVGVKVDDQFGTAFMDLIRPRFVCLPANKADEDPTAPGHPQGFLCYKTRQQAPFGDAFPFVNNQILAQQVEIIRRFELCVPSVIGGVPTTTTTVTAPPTTVGPSTTVTTTTAAPTTSTAAPTTTTLVGSASQAFVEAID